MCGCLDGLEKSGKTNTKVAAVILRKWSQGEGVACPVRPRLLFLYIVFYLYPISTLFVKQSGFTRLGYSLNTVSTSGASLRGLGVSVHDCCLPGPDCGLGAAVEPATLESRSPCLAPRCALYTRPLLCPHLGLCAGWQQLPQHRTEA